MSWVNPVAKALRKGAQFFRAGFAFDPMVERICELGWKGRGVRVYCYPCGTLALVRIGSEKDQSFLASEHAHLLATYARHGWLGPGPKRDDVISDLRWAIDRIQPSKVPSRGEVDA